MSFQSRDILHFVRARVTLGVDVREGEARVALAFASRVEPNYSRPAAWTLLNLRFDADDSTLCSLGIKRKVYSFPYEGTTPRNDIARVLTNLLKEDLRLREKSWGSVEGMYRKVKLYAEEQRQKNTAACRS